jgi:AcrR family transcriptional regulator
MQRLAAKLDFTTMALYRYLPGKAELIDLMVDTALGPPPALTESKRSWRRALEEWARFMSAAFYKHPWALEATDRLRPTGPNELGWMEAAVRALCETGLNGADQLDVLQAIMGQVRIEVQYSATFPDAGQHLSAKQWQAGISTLLEKHGARYPSLKSCLNTSSSFAELQPEIKLGLRCVLDGIDRLIEKNRRQRR